MLLEVRLSHEAMSIDCLTHAREQVIAVNRLLDKIDRTFAHRRNGNRNVRRPRKKDHRGFYVALLEVSLHFKAAHARHADIQNDAAQTIQASLCEELRA